ncbi:uncharacterized protein LOC131642216 [Vicia villosa]|uniref:uncharacterized protein LOC131642216 n=1 Tax=Vicia villosa TaxID=3911 RepID=UPI00273C75B2|nr:uncharacterized protein LOC131642216 [Vicia villosa]
MTHQLNDIPSYFEHVDALIPDSPTPKSKCSINKGTRISKPPRTPLIKKPLMIYIDEMPLFMHKYIDGMVDVGTNGDCGNRVIAGLLGRGEENHTLIRRTLISESNSHRNIYGRLYEKQENFDKVHDSLVPSLTAHAPVSKWMSFPEMDHLIAGCVRPGVCRFDEI